jgi:hypothetical protein
MGIRLLFVLLLVVAVSRAQPVEPGAQAAALGGSYVSQTSIFSARHNVAGLAFLENNAVAAGARNNYLAGNLNDFYLLGAFRQNFGTIGFDFTYFGIDAYRQGGLGLNYARQLSQKWSVGVRLAYSYNSIPQESITRHLVTADAGILGKFERWRIGATVQQLAQSQWQGRVEEVEPIVLRLGGGYFFTPQTSLTAELFQALNAPADVRLGLEYAPADALVIRLGFGTARPSVGFGVGLNLKSLSINLAATWHQQLGLSPITDVVYAW